MKDKKLTNRKEGSMKGSSKEWMDGRKKRRKEERKARKEGMNGGKEGMNEWRKGRKE